MKRIFSIFPALALLALLSACAAADPAVDEPRPDDAALNPALADAAQKFARETDSAGLVYHLYSPKDAAGEKLPLIVFVGAVDAPLEQGALVWATDDAQAAHPCFVLAPAFMGPTVNDAGKLSQEARAALKLIDRLAAAKPIDKRRIYLVGQNGAAMRYAVERSFAASIFVDCQPDKARLASVVRRPLVYVYAGEAGDRTRTAIEETCRKTRKGYAWMEWSAGLPLAEQDSLAATLLGKGQPVNLIGFEEKEGVNFDDAWKIGPIRAWLFEQRLGK